MLAVDVALTGFRFEDKAILCRWSKVEVGQKL